MVFNRYSAKMTAKDSIRRAKPRPFLVTLIFILITVWGPQLIMSLLGNNIVFDMLSDIQSGYDPAEAFALYFMTDSGSTLGVLIMNILIQLFIAVMSFGYSVYGMKVARNQQAGFGDLFYGFTKLGKALWLSILVGLFTNLWLLLFLTPAILIFFMGVFMHSMFLIALYPILMLAGMVGGMIWAMRYGLAYYFIIDEDCTSRQAITMSKQAMKGHLGEYIVLQLTFIGWTLLCGLTLGILNLWVSPYMEATFVNFYDVVRRPEGPDRPMYDGQVFNFGPGPNAPRN